MKANYSVASILGCAFVITLVACDGNQRILSGLVDPSSIVHSEVIRHGVDTIRLFEIKGDQETVDRLVAAWRLDEVTGEGQMSFLTNDAPSWWHNSSGESGWQKYTHADDSLERYWSVWYSEKRGSVFVEIGQW